MFVREMVDGPDAATTIPEALYSTWHAKFNLTGRLLLWHSFSPELPSALIKSTISIISIIMVELMGVVSRCNH